MIEEKKSLRRRTIVTSPHTQQDLSNVHARNSSVGLAPRPTHAGLQPIGASTRQHLVDTDDMVRVSADAEMEAFFTSDFDEVSVVSVSADCWYMMRIQVVLVGADTSSF